MASPSPKPTLSERVRDYFHIEREEVRPTLGISLYLLLGMASVICLKAAADSLFLSEFDAKRLPVVDLAVTVLVGVVVGLYLRLGNRISLERLTLMTQAFLVLNLVGIWYLLRLDVFGARAVLYVWVGLFSVLIPSQVWSLASGLFDTRQAKRLFSLIGAGGILGAALGGQFASWAGRNLDTESILLAAAGFVTASGVIVCRLTWGDEKTRRGDAGRSPAKASFFESFRLVRRTRYLSLITAALFLSFLVSTLVKYQFKAVTQAHFIDDPARMTQFFGDFYGYIAVFSFLFHTLFTGRLLRWLGLGVALFFLPVSMLAGAALLLFAPVLSSAVLARGCDQGFRHSLDRSSVELLYVPMAADVRKRVKSFIDMAVSRTGDGLASVVLLLLVSVLEFGLPEVALISVLCVLPWLVSVAWLRREYVSHLRHSIGRKDLRSEQIMEDLAGSASAEQLGRMSEGPDLRTVETAVDWMQFSGVSATQAHLSNLITHKSGVIRRKAMAVAASGKIPGYEADALRFLELETDIDSRGPALDYLEEQDLPAARKAMSKLLASEDRDLAATVAARLVGHGGPEAEAAREVFTAYLEAAPSADAPRRAVAARLLGSVTADQEIEKSLASFLADSDSEVQRAALLSAAAIRPLSASSLLIEALGRRCLRREARAALIALGPAALDRLIAAMGDSSVPLAARRRLPRVVSEIGGPRAVAFLIDRFHGSDRRIGLEILRALGRMRAKDSSIVFPAESIAGRLQEELRRYYEDKLSLYAIPEREATSGVQFLRRAVEERLEERLDAVFVLLGLIYPQREILDARYWIASGRPDLRSNAVEFLDSRLTNPVRQMLLPVLERWGQRRMIDSSRTLFALRPVSFANMLWKLLESQDPWVQACACHAAADAVMRGLREKIVGLAQSSDPILAETAAKAYGRLPLTAGSGNTAT